MPRFESSVSADLSRHPNRSRQEQRLPPRPKNIFIERRRLRAAVAAQPARLKAPCPVPAATMAFRPPRSVKPAPRVRSPGAREPVRQPEAHPHPVWLDQLRANSAEAHRLGGSYIAQILGGACLPICRSNSRVSSIRIKMKTAKVLARWSVP